MSGGALDYAFLRAHEAAQSLRELSPDLKIQLDFADHLDKVALALRQIEIMPMSDIVRKTIAGIIVVGTGVNMVRLILPLVDEIRRAAAEKASS